MKHYLQLLIIVALTVVMQVTLFPSHLEHPFRPNLPLIGVIWLAMQGRPLSAPVIVFLAGLFFDCFNGYYFGLSGFSFLFVYFVLTALADRLYTDSPYLLVVVVFFSSLAYGVVSGTLLLLFTTDEGILPVLGRSLLPQALMNALLVSILSNFGLKPGDEGGR